MDLGKLEKPFAAGRTGLMITLTLVITVLVFSFAIRPLFVSNTELKNEVTAKNQESDYLTQKITDLKVLDSNYNQLKDELNIIASAMPTFPNEQELLVQLSNIALTSGIDISSITPNQGQTAQTTVTGEAVTTAYKNEQIAIELVGSYPSIETFLVNCQKNIRTMNVVTLDLKKLSNATSVEANIVLEIYYQ